MLWLTAIVCKLILSLQAMESVDENLSLNWHNINFSHGTTDFDLTLNIKNQKINVNHFVGQDAILPYRANHCFTCSIPLSPART